MIFNLSDNIISPLGNSTAANVAAVRRKASALQRHDGRWGLPDSFVASLFSDEQRQEIEKQAIGIQDQQLTFFEKLAVASIRNALAGISAGTQTGSTAGTPTESMVDAASPRTVLIVSSTKANVAELSEAENSYSAPGTAALHIAQALGMTTQPLVVCNACISGLSAIIAAQRLLDAGTYDHAIVCGIDVQSPFIVSGFQSFRALSPNTCRPFDIERLGLNLGEAAATIVFGREAQDGKDAPWVIECGFVRNDAVHISNPSNKGEGLWRALTNLTDNTRRDNQTEPSGDNGWAFVNAHGTGTMFNDQMEAAALRRAGLNVLPVNALKGYYGHTMGAAGVLETILCMHAASQGWMAGTRGFEELGVSGGLQVSADERPVETKHFIKMLSGFGGCNAVVSAMQTSCPTTLPSIKKHKAVLHATHTVVITPQGATIDGKALPTSATGYTLLSELYRNHTADYPKFHKMDRLSQLGYLAAELLLDAEAKATGAPRFAPDGTSVVSPPREDRAVVFFNATSSVWADKKYLRTIENPEAFFPSPSVFVYTLPNIVTGEIALRNHYHGETSFYILPSHNAQREAELLGVLTDHISATEAHRVGENTTSVLGGWLDYAHDDLFSAEISIFELK